jgi:TolA-binding protein
MSDPYVKDRADWLVDAVACATQNRMFLRGEPECDQVAVDAIFMNGEKALRQVHDAQAAKVATLESQLADLRAKADALADACWRNVVMDDLIKRLRSVAFTGVSNQRVVSLDKSTLEQAAARIEALEARVAAADKLAELMAAGECPWREDTSNHREWWKERETALAAYQATKEGKAYE